MKKILLLLILITVKNTLFSQTITGKVSDTDGSPIFGVFIREIGTSNGVSTNFDGKYLIKLRNPKATLEYIFAGHVSQKIIFNDKTELDVVLQESKLGANDIVIVGSRLSKSTKNNISAVPIDIITKEDLTKFGQLDLNQVLHFLVPSFNSNRQSGSDIADHLDPSSFRGLGPDQTLVLINGKRFHQASVIGIFGTKGRGNSLTDFNSIPVAAIERIEILRDGAAAQYGSDAIAGVINIVLKSTTNSLNANLNSMISSENDGLVLNPNINYGLKIGKSGYANITADFINRAKSFRTFEENEILKNELPRKYFGDASLQSPSFYANAEIALSEKSKVYFFGGYHSRNTEAHGYSYESDSTTDLVYTEGKGFEPLIKSNIHDYNFSIGYKYNVGKNWNLELNNTFGKNEIDLSVKNTLNQSLLGFSPTSFDCGGYRFSQNTTSFQMSKNFADILKGIGFAFGAELRSDNYEILAGEEKSWKNLYNGDLVLKGGAANFPGIRPDFEINTKRNNSSIYADLETNITEKLLLSTALRFENYSDFGNTFNYKIASRYKFSNMIAVRGAYSTGFRAPSLAQISYTTVLNDIELEESSGEEITVERYIPRNSDKITKDLGIPQLKEETSKNISAGIVLQPSNKISLTVDAYVVNVNNRIILTGNFKNDDKQILQPVLEKFGANGAQFFANAMNTQTTGMDIVGKIESNLGKGTLTTSLGINFNNLKIIKVNPVEALGNQTENFVGERQKSLITHSAPGSKIHLILDYKKNKFTSNIRMNYFKGFGIVNYSSLKDDNSKLILNNYSDAYTLDANLGYKILNFLEVNLGASNITNNLPSTQNVDFTETGGKFESVQMGFGGRYFYGKLNFSF
ncbi:MAG: TonB-dependent receptor [Pseudarcicella sp.]|nr:TonB-dependent receptor [Pseudarcicella sp.]